MECGDPISSAERPAAAAAVENFESSRGRKLLRVCNAPRALAKGFGVDYDDSVSKD